MSQNYVPLPLLASEWATQAGVPIVMMTRRICEWAFMGAFGKTAFVNDLGDVIAPYDMLAAFRATVGHGQAAMGGATHYLQGHQIAARLDGALITAMDVMGYCERAGVEPPRSIAPRRRWFTPPVKWLHPAPPECPDVEVHVRRESENRHIATCLSLLIAMLAGLKGNRRLGRIHRDPNKPVDLKLWGDKWAADRARVLDALAAREEPEARQQLEALDREWDAFIQSELERWGEPDATETPPHDEVNDEPPPPPSAPVPLHIVVRGTKVYVGGHQVALSPASFRLLHELAKAVGGGSPIVPLEQLRALAGVGDDEKLLGQAIHRLRKALERDDPVRQIVGDWIENMKGIGYRLNLSPADIRIDR